ncbi:FAD:protein FMN transferase [Parvicella tangerina]|uniref:FAD:protein FMN transferase n=1 Tax=Parvicella tangerina TaxID=2829795 RepID=A0A916JPP9_9FLAO|nr:FAD:protein FMN transferase [Parvicella tangerina]CAG5084979.1 FAD:protein FMN transferase [Parvicella tangerina]
MTKNWLVLFAAITLWSCNSEVDRQESVADYYQIVGEAQGTTYAITFQGNQNPTKVKSSVDSLLAVYDLANSIYKPTSLITQLNNSSSASFAVASFPEHAYFKTCFEVAKDVYQLTNGAFNPAVYPLVNYWGFHKENFNHSPDSSEIKELLVLIDFSDESFNFKEGVVSRSNPEAKIDFNALAQGHSVDVVGDYLEHQGIENYMVEIGGELSCKGKNPNQQSWKIGIEKPTDDPTSDPNDFQMIATLTNKSLATSGNYRKFYEIDGQRYAHTIDPVSGYPARQNLLSVTVITDECVYADAFATAFMVMGMEKSITFIEQHPDLSIHAYFVYDENGQYLTKMTEGFEKFILQN